MSESVDEAVESVWDNSTLLKLITSLDETIPEGLDTTNYLNGMKSVDWSKVAFHPFSPEECKQKWTHLMEKMRKLRSLPDLIAEAKQVISNPLRYRTIHPDVPKRPGGPRNIYFMEHHQKIKEKYPNMKTQKIFKLLYKKFDGLSEEKKVVYMKKHAGQVSEYQKKMEEFGKRNKMHVKVKLAASYRTLEKEIEEMPVKPPHNSYSVFCMEHRKATGGNSKFDARKLSRSWKSLSLTEKAAYRTRCIELKRQYALEMNAYLNGFSKVEKKQLIKEKGIPVPKVPKRTAKMKEAREPKMPSQVPYSYFLGEQVKCLDKAQSSREYHLETRERWKAVPPENKERYKNKVHEATKRYIAELQKWFMTLEPEQQSKYLKENPSKSGFLDVNKMTNCDQIKPQFGQTSDSEDELIANISDEEDDMPSGYEEQNDEEEEDIIMFEIN